MFWGRATVDHLQFGQVRHLCWDQQVHSGCRFVVVVVVDVQAGSLVF